MLLIGSRVDDAWKLILGGGAIVPSGFAILTLLFRLGGFNSGGGFEMFMLGIGARIIGLI